MVDGVRRALADLVGSDHLREVGLLNDFAVDGMRPALVVEPGIPEDVAMVLALAEREDLGVVPWGGGTGQGLGNLPRRYDLALRLGRLDRVLDHQPADLTVTVEAGVPLDRLQERLAEHGQFLPLDPPCSGQATIGGILACAAGGPRRLRYGGPRDLLLGVRVAHPNGTLSRAGGKVVKNVAGFDLNRLYTGSLGTLGVVVEATFKVLPLPARVGAVFAVFSSLDAAVSAGRALLNGPARPLALDLLSPAAVRLLAGPAGLTPPETGYALVVELGGVAAAVARQLEDFGALAAGAAQVSLVAGDDEGRLHRALCDLGWGAVPAPLILRASGLPTAVRALIAAWEAAGERLGLRLALRSHLGSGILEGFCFSGDGGGLSAAAASGLVQTCTAAASRAGASLVVTACSPEVKAQLDVWGPVPESFPLMRQIKAEFDPKGILNPGRFVGRL